MPSDESKGSQLDAIGSLAQRQLDNTLRQLTAGLGADLWGCSSKLALACFPAPRSLARTPVPDPWRAFGRNPALSGCHGERDTKLRRSRRVSFCRHPSRPRVEWPDLPGRGNRQRLSVRWQNLSVPHYHRKANHRHPVLCQNSALLK